MIRVSPNVTKILGTANQVLANKPIGNITLSLPQSIDTAANVTFGIVNAATGFRVSGIATTGNVLRGNGTNFVNATLAEADLSFTDITTNNFSTTKHGFVPKGTNVGSFLKDDGTWASPGGGGDMLLSGVQTVTGAKTFNSGKLILAGATSGTITVNAAATAGANIITLPAGTTDFSATGGASQVVKQTTAGGAFTVATLTPTDVGLGNVTNNSQTQASIVPNTAPTAGQILIGNAGNTAYAKQTVSGSGATITLGATGILTISSIANASLTGNTTNWDTAFTERAQWDGGATNLVAATGRNSLGGTTLGQNFFTVVNPTAIRFFRSDATNNLVLEDAPTFRASIGAGTGSGTVTTFTAGNLSPLFTSSVATAGTTPALTFAVDATTAANTVYGRAAGTSGAATFSSSPQFTAIGNLTTNGFIKTSGGVGTLTVDTSTYLTANQSITLSGDVTGTGATAITTVLANIPTATPAVGSIIHTNIASPANPGVGKVATYSDTTDNRFHDRNNSGVIGTTIVADTGSANNFLTAISAAGVISKAQPTPANVGLGNVTNTAQTNASIVPNTAPTAGQLLVGNAGNTAYAPVTLTNATLSSAGALTGVANAALANSAITIAGTSTSLGGTITRDTITGLSGTGIVKQTAANTLAFATAGTDYLTGNQSITLSGDVSGTGTTAITTAIGTNKVTYAMMQDVTATNRFLGRITVGAGDPEELTAANAKTILALTSTDVGLGSVTNNAQAFASVHPNTAPTAGQILVGNAGNTAYAPQTVGTDATLTSAGALTISNNVVTLAKMATMGTDSILGRTTAATGNVEVLSALPWAYTGDVTRAADSNALTYNNAVPTTKAGLPTGGTANQVLSKIDATNYNTQWVNPTGGSGSSVTKAIAQTTHGFAVGDLIKYTGSAYAKALADSAINSEVVGMVSAVADANNFTLMAVGYATGLTSLTAGNTYFLSPTTAGTLTTTEPSTVGQVSKPIFVADSTTSGYFNNWRGIVKTLAGSGGGGSADFLGLTDTPDSYSGQASKVVAVNPGATALEFITLAGGGNVSNSGTPTAGQMAQWISGTAIKGVTLSGSGATMSIDTSGVLTISAIAGASLSDGGVTYAKIQNVSVTSRFLGRVTGGAGVVEELTAANAKTILALTSTDVGLGSVTNNAQTQASIVPNTAPTSGQILIGNAGNTAYAKQSISGSGATFTLNDTGVLTVSAILNASLPATISGKTISTTTIDGTNTYTAKDGSFTLQNTAATTKQAIFGLSNITAGQTRTINIPDANSTTVQADTGAASNFLTAISAQGVISKAQPVFTNLSGNYTLAQGPTTTASVLLGRGSSGTGVPQEITLGTNLSITGTTLNATGGGGSGASLSQSVAQTTHGFAVGNVIRYTGSAYAKAQADTSPHAEVVGIVSAVADANNFTLLSSGYITGLSGLTAGSVYFLDPTTAGTLTTTEPSTVGQVLKPVLIAISTTAGYFNNFRGVVKTVSATGAETLTNKRIDPRTTVSATGNTTPTPDVSTTDEYIATGMTVGMTFGAPTGTPVQGTKLLIRIKDDGTARSLAWNAIYKPIGVTLPTTTVANKLIYMGGIYNATASQWDVTAVASEA